VLHAVSSGPRTVGVAIGRTFAESTLGRLALLLPFSRVAAQGAGR